VGLTTLECIKLPYYEMLHGPSEPTELFLACHEEFCCVG